MFHRALGRPTQSFFLFGPRGSGKSTWLRANFSKSEAQFLDLLDLKTQRRYQRNPESLQDELMALPKSIRWVIIDEIQKIPSLLDTVHSMSLTSKLKFGLSGSSTRKLRRGGANLLAGRAVEYHLFPLSAGELGKTFRLSDVLNWGTLPRIFQLKRESERIDFLETYAHLYVKEEIQEEQVVRRIDPFRAFLEVSAQMDGKILNFAKIAREAGVDTKTTMSYFKILEDTLLGFTLPAYHRSVRKRQRLAPKFYFFDLGVRRALEGRLEEILHPGTSEWGRAFESWIINEILKENGYSQARYKLSYLNADADSEIDLILEKGGKPKWILEIKSTDRVTSENCAALARFLPDFPGCRALCLSNDLISKNISGVSAHHWRKGLDQIFQESR
ncbi:MAG: AAA family ATPase [Bdellovibrionota bacterium]